EGVRACRRRGEYHERGAAQDQGGVDANDGGSRPNLDGSDGEPFSDGSRSKATTTPHEFYNVVLEWPFRVDRSGAPYFSISISTPPPSRWSSIPRVREVSSTVTPFGLLIPIAPAPTPAVAPDDSSVYLPSKSLTFLRLWTFPDASRVLIPTPPMESPLTRTL